VDAAGEALISRTPQSGGAVSTATCKEQLLYELHDPARYLTPDVTADFTGVRLAQQSDRLIGMHEDGIRIPDTLFLLSRIAPAYIAGAHALRSTG
jgi:hypothetical protein